MYGQGSLPEFVMRTGVLSPFGPTNIYRDVKAAAIARMTALPTSAPTAPNPPTTTVPSVSAAGPIAGSLGNYLGADAEGRAVREFPITGGAPTTEEAKVATAALKETAKRIRKIFKGAAIPELVGGPLSSLARGEAIVLRWPNGVAIQAAL
jgi:hypothetical protein